MAACSLRCMLAAGCPMASSLRSCSRPSGCAGCDAGDGQPSGLGGCYRGLAVAAGTGGGSRSGSTSAGTASDNGSSTGSANSNSSGSCIASSWHGAGQPASAAELAARPASGSGGGGGGSRGEQRCGSRHGGAGLSVASLTSADAWQATVRRTAPSRRSSMREGWRRPRPTAPSTGLDFGMVQCVLARRSSGGVSELLAALGLRRLPTAGYERALAQGQGLEKGFEPL